MSTETFSILAQQQAALVAALSGRAPAPHGFDRSRLSAAADALARKRRNAVARAWPQLARAMNDRFAACFEAYASVTALPERGGPLADGRAFARWLKGRKELPAAGALEALAVDMQYVMSPNGLARRRGPVVKFAWLAELRRLVVAMRVPWLGEHWFQVPLPGRWSFLRSARPFAREKS